jgi:hypothetical protein
MKARIGFGGALSAAALCLTLLLAACANVLPAGTPRFEGVRTIGIVSAFTNVFGVQKIGITVFGNDLKQFQIDSWNLDEVAISRARSALSGRFDVRPVTYQKGEVAKGGACGDLRESLRTVNSPQPLDAYILIKSWGAQYGNSNRRVFGFGILEVGGGLMRNNVIAHAIYNVTLVDGRTFACKDWNAAVLPGNLFAGNVRGPAKQVDPSLWPTSLDAASNQRLKAMMVELIDQSLPATIQVLENRHLDHMQGN